MMNKISNSELINGGTIALAIGALSLALGHAGFFSLLAVVGLAAYGVVVFRYVKKPKTPDSGTDRKTSDN